VRAALAALLALAAPLPFAAPAAAQTPPFRFSAEAGAAIRALWDESVTAQAERVACLGATVEDGVVHVSRLLPLPAEEADSMGISATSSVERCGPPEWAGTLHTHVAEYDENGPSRRFSGQDRTAMRMWYDRWHADGVFCVVYSERDAHCEADGVVGGLRSRPRIVK
jgi:hypothetical protein